MHIFVQFILHLQHTLFMFISFVLYYGGAINDTYSGFISIVYYWLTYKYLSAVDLIFYQLRGQCHDFVSSCIRERLFLDSALSSLLPLCVNTSVCLGTGCWRLDRRSSCNVSIQRGRIVRAAYKTCLIRSTYRHSRVRHLKNDPAECRERHIRKRKWSSIWHVAVSATFHGWIVFNKTQKRRWRKDYIVKWIIFRVLTLLAFL